MRAVPVCVVVLLFMGMVPCALGQEVRAYLTAGTGSIDYLVHRETIPQASGGFLGSAADGRVRVGGEGDLLTSNGYFAGKGGPLAEVPLLRGRVQPFVRGGYFWGEDNSWIAGAGIDVWLGTSVGIRAFVQDAFRRSRVGSGGSSAEPHGDSFHEPSAQVGIVWQ
jgi:hypothetical protein